MDCKALAHTAASLYIKGRGGSFCRWSLAVGCGRGRWSFVVVVVVGRLLWWLSSAVVGGRGIYLS